jgi:DNA-binding transcriptional MerR regulator/effector-binding domain-containing protein
MFKIGEFSRFTRVSVKTLRHYDELGLLRPRVVDRFTNYRYYSADQVPRLNQILALRELGFSLEQIGRLLDAELSPEQLRGMFLGKRDEIVDRIRAEEAQLGRVDAYLSQLADAGTGNDQARYDRARNDQARYDIVMRRIEPVLVASVRSWVVEETHTPDEQMEVADPVGAIFEEVEQYVARFQARAPLPPATIYHDREYHASGQDLEVVVPLTIAIPQTERIRVYELAGWASMACLIHSGGYEDLMQTLAALLRWVELNHFEIAGPMRESYLRFGADQAGYELPESYLATHAHELVTELQLPVVAVAHQSSELDR